MSIFTKTSIWGPTMSEQDGLNDSPGHVLLHGEDPPGQWQHASTAGGWITFRLPNGVAIDEYEPGPEKCVELVMDIDGEYEDEDKDRPVELWAVTYRPDRIVMNYRDVGSHIDETVGLYSAAELAVEWMEENPGKSS